jgi:diketogulonate reductase-like aldo/keto reductase
MVESDNLRYTRIALNNGSGAIPALGFGTLIPDPMATRTATKAALEAGFRQLDASERYRNEKEVGEAMQEVFKARALEGLVDEGKCKAIGLSDVGLAPTKEIFEVARIKPAVVHVESHPYLPQWDLLDYCGRNGIVLQAFAALGHSSKPNLLEDPVITAIAKRVNKTPAQVLLAWAIQRGTALLTTSKTPSRIKENFEVSTLPQDAMREISEGIKSRVRFNAVTETGVPGFIPSGTSG